MPRPGSHRAGLRPRRSGFVIVELLTFVAMFSAFTAIGTKKAFDEAFSGTSSVEIDVFNSNIPGQLTFQDADRDAGQSIQQLYGELLMLDGLIEDVVPNAQGFASGLLGADGLSGSFVGSVLSSTSFQLGGQVFFAGGLLGLAQTLFVADGQAHDLTYAWSSTANPATTQSSGDYLFDISESGVIRGATVSARFNPLVEVVLTVGPAVEPGTLYRVTAQVVAVPEPAPIACISALALAWAWRRGRLRPAAPGTPRPGGARRRPEAPAKG